MELIPLIDTADRQLSVFRTGTAAAVPLVSAWAAKTIASLRLLAKLNGRFPSCIRGFDSLRPLQSQKALKQGFSAVCSTNSACFGPIAAAAQ